VAIGGGGGGDLKLRVREERVRHLEIDEGGGVPWKSSPRGGDCSGGSIYSSTVDGELRHRRGQEAMGSGGGFVLVPVGGEKDCGEKKWATTTLDAF
jgi:hypothetical protein